jgi:NAD+ synthase (glutamine-hydrolysing)
MPVRAALAQINPTVGDLEGNAALIVKAGADAAQRGANLVVLPEMALTGYPIEDLALRRSFQAAAQETLAVLARQLEARGAGAAAVVVGSLGTDRAGRPTNIAAVLRGGGVESVYTKRRLPNYGVFDEYRLFTPGATSQTIDVDGARVGIAICEDIWDDAPAAAGSSAEPARSAGLVPGPELPGTDGPVANLAREGGVDLLAVLNGSPFELGKSAVREERAAAAARLLGAPVAYVNLVGGQDDLVFDGGSFVMGPNGRVLAGAGRFHAQILMWDPADRGHRTPALGVDEQIYRAIVLGCGDYVRKNGFANAILGLSGGIDSALTAAIATDALGRGAVVGVSMPSVHSSRHSLDDAAETARRLGLDYRTVPIEAMVSPFVTALGLDGVAGENIQARVRGMILMSLANMEGHLVLATGNKSELATGYSTVYGDAVGGFAPLKDLSKTRVRSLSRWRNDRAESDGEVPPIPENSIAKPPSAELRPGQFDAQSLPEYDILDAVLDRYVEQASSRQDLLASGHPAPAVDLALSLTDRAEWKRRQYPPGPKVTAVAFGRDRRLPITSRWVEP